MPIRSTAEPIMPKMKKTPSRNTASETGGIFFQKELGVFMEFASNIARSFSQQVRDVSGSYRSRKSPKQDLGLAPGWREPRPMIALDNNRPASGPNTQLSAVPSDHCPTGTRNIVNSSHLSLRDKIGEPFAPAPHAA